LHLANCQAATIACHNLTCTAAAAAAAAFPRAPQLLASYLQVLVLLALRLAFRCTPSRSSMQKELVHYQMQWQQ
jgi:hypothetical protein